MTSLSVKLQRRFCASEMSHDPELLGKPCKGVAIGQIKCCDNGIDYSMLMSVVNHKNLTSEQHFSLDGRSILECPL